jgi:hypothetical protein
MPRITFFTQKNENNPKTNSPVLRLKEITDITKKKTHKLMGWEGLWTICGDFLSTARAYPSCTSLLFSFLFVRERKSIKKSRDHNTNRDSHAAIKAHSCIPRTHSRFPFRCAHGSAIIFAQRKGTSFERDKA